MSKGLIRLAAVTAAAAAVAFATLQIAGAQRDNAYAWFDPIIDVQRLIDQRYVVEPDMGRMQEDAIRAMIDSLGDPYTQYIPTQLVDDFNKQVRGEYVGIGATVRLIDGWVTVYTPHEGSPALAAGVRAGDRIVQVDDTSTEGMNIQDVVDLLTGVPGTRVLVTVERDGERTAKEIIRGNIVVHTVRGFWRRGAGWDWMLDPERGVGYVRIESFNTTTAEEFRSALEEMNERGLRSLVIDLRFNGGGLVSAAIQVVDSLIDEGLIVGSRGRAHPEDGVYATPETTLTDAPVMVLLNRQSASASEIVAGALKDHDRAVVLGERSFGKGSMQSTIRLPSGAGSLHLTEHYYFGPSGATIHRRDDSTEWGIDPSPGFFVPMTDPEYSRMLNVRSDLDVIKGVDGAPDEAIPEGVRSGAWVGAHLADKQLAGALDAAIARAESGQWRAVGEESGGAAALEELRRLRLARERVVRDLQRLDRRVAALSSVSDAEGAAPDLLLPGGAELVDGAVIVYDKDGNIVQTLRVTAPGLERWFLDAPLEIVPEEDCVPTPERPC